MKDRELRLQERVGRYAIQCLAWAQAAGVLVAGDSRGYIHRLAKVTVRKARIKTSSYPFTKGAAISKIVWSPSPLGRCLLICGHQVAIIDEQDRPLFLNYGTPVADAGWRDERTFAVMCQNGLLEIQNTLDLRLGKPARRLEVEADEPQCLVWHQKQLVIGTGLGEVLCLSDDGQRSVLPTLPHPITNLISQREQLIVEMEHAHALAQWHGHGQGQLMSFSPTLAPVVLHPQGQTLASRGVAGVICAQL
jgi:hypothetical protein